MTEAAGPPGWLSVAVLVVLVVGAGAGAALRAVVLARVAASGSTRARSLGSAWVNVPASVLAAAALVWQAGSGLAGGDGPGTLALLAVLGLCGGLSTWSTLSLELARSLLDADRAALRLQLGGVALGVVGGVFGAGLAAVGLMLG